MTQSDNTAPATKADIQMIIDQMATKSDIQEIWENMATKEDLKTMATKEDLKALKEELELFIDIRFENYRIDFNGAFGDQLAWVKDVQKGHSRRLRKIEAKVFS